MHFELESARSDKEKIIKLLMPNKIKSNASSYLFVSENMPERITIDADSKRLTFFSKNISIGFSEVFVQVRTDKNANKLADAVIKAGSLSINIEAVKKYLFNFVNEINYNVLKEKSISKEMLLKAIFSLEQQYWAYQAFGSIEDCHQSMLKGLSISADNAIPAPTFENIQRYIEVTAGLQWLYEHYLYSSPRKAISISGLIKGFDKKRSFNSEISIFTKDLEYAFMRLKPIEAELRFLASRIRSINYRAGRTIDTDHSGTIMAVTSFLASPIMGVANAATRFFLAENKKTQMTGEQLKDTVESIDEVINTWSKLHTYSIGPIYGAFMSDIFSASGRFWAAIGGHAEPGTDGFEIMIQWCARLMTFLSWPTELNKTRGGLVIPLISRIESEPSLSDYMLV